MNGAVDNQVSDNAWGRASRTILHQYTQSEPLSSASPASEAIISGYEQQMADHESDFSEMMDGLRSMYIFTSAEDVESFLRLHRNIAPILLEAYDPFRNAFDNAPIALDIMNEEGAPRAIYALAIASEGREKARASLNAFDENWLLTNVRKTAGKVVFDYELGR